MADAFPLCQIPVGRQAVIPEHHLPATTAVWWRLGLFVAVVTSAVVLALTTGVPSAADVQERIADAGWAAPVAFVGIYALVTLAPVPKNALSAVGGLLFGLGQGVALVFAAAMVGALAAFWLGRVLGRSAVERLTNARVRDVDELIARRGLLAVILVRLVPVVPFTAINYAAGLTAVRVRDYTLGTAIGMVPGTIAYVALGAFGTRPAAWPFLAAGFSLLLLTVGGLALARRWRQPRAGVAD